jgi:hypothetical protein
VAFKDLPKEEYDDPNGLLNDDLRQRWWTKYGELTGRGYTGLPKELDREDLAEITAQPFLNYLVALSFTRDRLDFSKEINLNRIYDDFLGRGIRAGLRKATLYADTKHDAYGFLPRA